MEHITNTNIKQNVPTAVTLGNFDGVHMGHRSLINLMKEKAEEQNLKSIVFSFYPHPMFLFGTNSDSRALIMGYEEKKMMIEKMGVDAFIEYPFTKEFASLSPEEFARLIFEQLNCKVLVVGFNYHFGKMAKGNGDLLKEIGKEYGVEVICVPSVNFLDERVSSTRVRKALANAEIDIAGKLLTVPYFVHGEVIHGKKLGRGIGFPTMNVDADKTKLFPPNGVYATRTVIDGKFYNSVTNIGIQPTVNGTDKVVETNVFDFNEDVYGKKVTVYFFDFIRAEQKFSGIEELKNQLAKDVETSKKYFESESFDYWKENY